MRNAVDKLCIGNGTEERWPTHLHRECRYRPGWWTTNVFFTAERPEALKIGVRILGMLSLCSSLRPRTLELFAGECQDFPLDRRDRGNTQADEHD